jgi:pyruvate/2-oxoglutarate dehydrogenase complex dihydrolipoamide acyltransferase (E2) component
MMTTEIKVPFLGDGIDQVTVCCWHHKIGDAIAQGEDLVEVEADKAIFNISSEHKGYLKKILISKGQEAPIGQTIAVIEHL